MPILDVELIGPRNAGTKGLARRIADAVAKVLGTGPQRTWVKVRRLSPADYAENAGAPGGMRPVFVRVLKRKRAGKAALKKEALALTRAIARACRRPPENVHVLYEPEGSGRVRLRRTS